MSTQLAKKSFSQLLDSDAVKNRIKEVLASRSNQFITSALSLVNSDAKLQQCEPTSLFNACLVSASLNLPINNNLGFAYIIPYNDKNKGLVAQFQIGYKAFIQLAIRSGEFKFLNADDVREGELSEINPMTGELKINRISDYSERKKANIIGYFAYFELLNGFNKVFFMSSEEINEHAKKYSQNFKKFGSGLWKDDFDGMAKKTVLKLLLSKYAPLSIEMQKAIIADQGVIKNEETLDVDYYDNSNQVIDEYTQEQSRIREFILKAETLEELEQIEALETSEENRELLNDTKKQIIENGNSNI